MPATPTPTGQHGASAPEGERTWVPSAGQTTAFGSGGERTIGGALERGELVGRYLILTRIGQGGMGVVYAAHDPELDRKVALKLLLVGSSDATGRGELRTRLLREAQALAQLAHPCVVTVHDVGTLGDRVWIAMEFIEGVTLSAWLAQQPRRWQEVVAVMRRAGEGLAAAHAAGLVHRDFKPDNVMVSADGRVRVMDFGLARAERSPAPVDLRASASALEMAVTQAGAVMGTPQYMAPEQWLGAETDARTDQFAFCVTLWEALYHQRPYGDALTELAMAVTEGRRREPPRSAGVPSWLRDVVERGLATNASARWPSMTALLAALAGGAGRRRRRLALAGALALVTGLGGLGVHHRVAAARQVRACEAAGAELRATSWNDETREQLRAALLATGVPYAAMTFDHLAPTLDRFTDAWEGARTQLCLREAVEESLDAATAERGRDCLLEAKWSLEALLAVLAEGDPGSVQPAVNAAARLPIAATCLDPTWLAHRARMPQDEAALAEVVEVRRGLERARAMAAAGRYEEGATHAQVLVERADATGWRPLSAHTRVLAGELADRAGEAGVAEKLLEDGLHLAVELGEDGVAADAATSLADVVGDNLARFDEGLRWGRLAGDLIRRLDQQNSSRDARLGAALAGVYEARGDYRSAEPHAARTLMLWEQLLGVDNPSVALATNNLAIVLYNLGRTAEARQMFERSLALTERALGPAHPNVAAMLNNLGNIHLVEDDLTGAQALLARAMQIREASLGAEHPSLAISLLNLAGVELTRGDLDAAARHSARASALYERGVGPEHPDFAAAIENTALILRARGELDEALAVQLRSLAIRERRLGREHHDRATGLHNLGDIRRSRGELAEAERCYAEAIALYEQAHGAADERLLAPLHGLAELALGRGQQRRAIALLERAVAIGEDATASPRTLAEPRFALARALQPNDPARAQALARQALAGLRGDDPHAGKQRAEIEAWLAANATPP